MEIHRSTSRRRGATRSLAVATLVALALATPARAQQILVNRGFESSPPTTFGDHINHPVTPWTPIGGGQANVVRVDHGVHPYGGGPNVDASGAPGARHYLDIANAGNGIYQLFTPQCNGKVTFSGSFSSRVYMGSAETGNGSIDIRQGGIGGTPIASASVTSLKDGVGWTARSATATLTAGTTYAFVVTLDNNLNFDEASATYDQACPNEVTEQVGEVINQGPTMVVPPDPCCPPWSQQSLEASLQYQGTSITAPYTLHWQPPASLNAQMQAYIAYLHAVDPSYTSISIAFGLFNAGTGATPSTPGTQVGGPVVMTWTWNGSGPSGPTNWFPAGAMSVNRWYTVATTIFLNDGLTFFPDTCSNVAMSVRLQVAAGGVAPGGNARSGRGPRLEVRPASARVRLPVPARRGPPARK